MRIVFFGSPAFAVPAAEAVARDHEVVLAVAQPDRPAGRGQKVQAPAVKVWAEANGVPVAQPQRLRGPEGDAFLERVQVLAPDVFIVAAYGKILPQALLDVPHLGPFNVHASLLPKYRGAAPIQWAVIRGDEETGVTIMRMEAGLDTGPMVAVCKAPIGPSDTAGALFERLAVLGAQLMADTLPAIATGKATFTPQDEAQATLAPPLTKDDGHLDFSQPAERVSARARGVDPWPSAYALLDGAPIKLFGARVLATQADAAAPGQVVSADREGLVVACGPGLLAFSEVQMPGRKRLPVEAVVAGRGLMPGMKLV